MNKDLNYFVSMGITQSFFSKGLRFIDSLVFFYKTKTPLISRQLASDKAF